MRTFLVLPIAALLAIATVGCTKHNPLSCCATQEQCSMYGLGSITPCQDKSQVCDQSGTCVAPQCSTSADCSDPNAPVCVNQLCVASCTQDADCMGLAGKPFCASDGTCVACKDDTQCTADAPVCDATAHACRGCTHDAECPGGLCLEADGTCVPDSQAIFLTNFGSDTGSCIRSAPCKSFSYGLQAVTSSRNVIHIDGGTYSLGTSSIPIGNQVYVDGTSTTLSGPFNAPLFSVSHAAMVLEGVTLSGVTSGPVVTVGTAGSVRLYGGDAHGDIDVNGGAVALDHSKMEVATMPGPADAVTCHNGTVSADRTMFDGTDLWTTNCQLTARRNYFDVSNSSIVASGGNVLVENNVIVESYELATCASIDSVGSGSQVRFNTFVNTSSVASDGEALDCDSTVEVTSNIFAYGSMHPLGNAGTCAARYSLFDSVALQQQTAGPGNITGDSSTFFKDKAGKDFHLAAGSPAIGAAEQGLPTNTDYDGAPRPQPAGSMPDMGAYEAP